MVALLSAALVSFAPARAGEPAAAVVTAADAWVDYGRVASLSVTVAADGATPTGEATATLGDRELGTAALEDGSGTIDVAARALAPRAAPYVVTVSYAGDGVVSAGSDTAELKVRRGRVIVWATVTPRRAEVGEDRVTAVVEILNTDGVQRTGRVTLSARVGSDSDTLQGGRAFLKLPPFRRTGLRQVVLAYGGSALLRPARATYEVQAVR